MDIITQRIIKIKKNQTEKSDSGHPRASLLAQLQSHLSEGTVQLAHSTPAFAVKFSGEDGIDVGGLYKDLLSSISQVYLYYIFNEL